jgi:exonuclease III
MRLMTWNLAGRKKKLGDQLKALEDVDADVVALQEITETTLPHLKAGLTSAEYNSIISSIELYPDHPFKGPRKYGLLLASKWPLKTKPVKNPIPWPERFLSCICEHPQELFDLHTTHIPPGSSNGWIKIDMFEAIYQAVAEKNHGL